MNTTIKFSTLLLPSSSGERPRFARVHRVAATFEGLQEAHRRELMIMRKVMIEHVGQYAVHALRTGNEFNMDESMIYILNTIDLIPLCQSAVESAGAQAKGFHLKKRNDGALPIDVTSDDIESKDGTLGFSRITSPCFLFCLQPGQSLHIKHITVEKKSVLDTRDNDDYRYQGGIRVTAFPTSSTVSFTLNLVSDPPETDIEQFVRTVLEVMVHKLRAIRTVPYSPECVALANCDNDICDLVIMRLTTMYLKTVSFVGMSGDAASPSCVPKNDAAAPSSSSSSTISILLQHSTPNTTSGDMVNAAIRGCVDTYSAILEGPMAAVEEIYDV